MAFLPNEALGNLPRDPRASLPVVDFDDGTVLQPQGRVEIVWSGDGTLATGVWPA